MMFSDPFLVKCKECKTDNYYSVKKLLALEETCNNCGAPLSETGKWMLSEIESWSAFLFKMEIVAEIENEINQEITEQELESMDLVIELVNIIQLKFNFEQAVAEKLVLKTINKFRTNTKLYSISAIDKTLKFNEIYNC